MSRDRVLERGAEMRSLAIVAGETGVRLGDVGGRAVQRREPVLLRHGQDLERGLRAVAATYGHLEDLGLAAVSRHLQVALGAVDLPEQVRAARTPAAIVNRERRTAGAARACNPATARTPCFFASAASCSASCKPLPSGHSQYTAFPALSAAVASWK